MSCKTPNGNKGEKNILFFRFSSFFDKQVVEGGATAYEVNDGKCSSVVLQYNVQTDGRDFNSHNSFPHEPGNQSVHAVRPRLFIGQLALSINVYRRLVTSYYFSSGTSRQCCEKEFPLLESRTKEC